MPPAGFRWWPRSLRDQLLLAVALALLVAQAISAGLLYSAQSERRQTGLVHSAAMRLFAAHHEDEMFGPPRPARGPGDKRRSLVEHAPASPLQPGDRRVAGAETELQQILAGQGFAAGQVVVFRRPASDDPHLNRRLERRASVLGTRAPPRPREMLVAAVELPQRSGWLVVRTPIPPPDRWLLATLLGQTLLLFTLMFGAIALILRQMTKPLAALTGRLERFAATPDPAGQLVPQGPADLRRLILAHNAMEARISAMLDEKDVMLGAIGHDLKTPLAALRVRIESVEDDAERGKMARTIEDITRSLDDILSLARVGRPSDPLEPAELSALVAQLAEEFEDMGQPVSFTQGTRIVLPLRVTWLRRAVRNLVVNALRYGQTARISLAREGGRAVIRIDDDGPGIAPDQLARMLEPFTRGEPSRNSSTGGAGLGLTLARAIADQHGGQLSLTNRHDAAGQVTGLTATLALPLA